jgi:chorismate mutase-like protein
MPAKPTSLADLRQKIDEIDSSIHDLIMLRSDLAEQIAVAKAEGAAYIRPGREAQVVRRLMDRHQGSFPRPVLARIWREIISVSAALQGPVTAAVYAPEQGPALTRLARDQFGSMTPITEYGSEMGVLRAITDGLGIVGVLPLPESDRGAPWWRNLAREGDSAPRIIARLPFAAIGPQPADAPQALVVSLTEQEESGYDHSFLIVETREAISRGALKNLLKSAEFGTLESPIWDEAPDRGLHLLEVEGFVAPDDPRLERLVEVGSDIIAQASAAGAYAVPFSVEELNIVKASPKDKP